MKTLKLSIKTAIAGIFMLAVVFNSSAQSLISTGTITSSYPTYSIAPSKGDRMDFFLNGDVWETNLTNKSHFALKVFISEDALQFVWILNLDMPEIKFKKLKEFIELLPSVCVTGETMMTANGSKPVLDSFDVRWCDERSDYIPISSENKVDIFSLQSNIRRYVLNNR